MHPWAEFCRLHLLQLWTLYRLRNRRWWIPCLVAFLSCCIPTGVVLFVRSLGPEGKVVLRSPEYFPSLYLNNATMVPIFRRIVYAPDNPYTYSVLQKVNSTFGGLHLEAYGTREALEKRLLAPDKALGEDMAAILFSPRCDAHHLEYTFRLVSFPKDATSRTDKTRSSWRDPGPRPMLLRERKEVPLLVSSIFRGHMQYWKYSASPIFLQRFPFPAYSPEIAFLGIVHWIPAMIITCSLICVVCFACLLIKERDLHVYLRAMGFVVQDRLTSFFRILIPLLLHASLAVVLLHVPLKKRGAAIFEATSWSTTLPLLLLYSCQLTLLVLCMAALIKTCRWCICAVVFIWCGTCVIPVILLKRFVEVNYWSKFVSSLLLPNFGTFWAFRAISTSEATGMGLTLTSPMDLTLLGYVGLLAGSCVILLSTLCIIDYLFGKRRRFTDCFQKAICQSSKNERVNGATDTADTVERGAVPLTEVDVTDARPAADLTREVLLLKDIKAETRQRIVLSDVDLEVLEGRITVVLDQEAYGTTELFKIITGYKGPSEGKLERKYKCLGVQTDKNTYMLSLRVRELLYRLAVLRGCTAEEAPANIESALAHLQLVSQIKESKKAKELPQCELSRLHVAIATIGKPDLIVLKDPTAFMTEDGRKVTWEYLRHLRDSFNAAVLLMTSSPTEAEVFADILAVLEGGKIRCTDDLPYIHKKLGIGYEVCVRKGPNWNPSEVEKLMSTTGFERSDHVTYWIGKREPQDLTVLLQGLEAYERDGTVSGIRLNFRTLHNQRARCTSSDETDSSMAAHSIATSFTKRPMAFMQLCAVLKKKYDMYRRGWKCLLVIFLVSNIVAFLVNWILVETISSTHMRGPLTYVAPEPSAVLSAPPGEPFLQHYFNESVRTEDIPAKVLEGGLQGYADRFLMGVGVLRDGVLAWFNGARLHTSIMALVTVQDAMLKNVTRNQSAAVVASNHPLLDSTLYARGILTHHLWSALLLSIALALLASIPAVHVARERASRFYRLQMSSGLHPVRYWVGNFLWDGAYGLLYAGVLTMLSAVAERSGDLCGAPAAALFVLLWVHALSMLFPLYTVATLFSPLWTFVTVAIGGSFTGCFGLWAAHAKRTWAFEEGKTSEDPAMWALRFIPFFSAPWGVANLRFAGALRKECSIHSTRNESCDAVDQRCCAWNCYNGVCPSLGPWTLTEGGVGDETLALLALGTLFCFLFVIYYIYVRYYKFASRKEDSRVILDVADLRYKKRKNRFELQNICTEVKHGQCLGIIGPTLSGKTSLLRMIAGDMAPSQGRIKVTRSIGFCPQDDWLPRDVSTREVLHFFARIRGVMNAEECCRQWLQLIDISGERLCGSLRSGELRLLSVCCAFVGHPRLLVIDEPCAHMEVTHVQFLRHILETRKEDTAVVLSMRTVNDCLQQCELIKYMEGGRLSPWENGEQKDGYRALLVHFTDPSIGTQVHDYQGTSRSAVIRKLIDEHRGQSFSVEDATRENFYRANKRSTVPIQQTALSSNEVVT